MKKLTFLFFVLATMLVVSCKSGYSNLNDGLYADIQTNKGDMLLQLFYKQTPVTVANFVTLAEGTNPLVADSLKGKPYYDGVIFHRVIKDFVIQGGDRTGTGMGDPGYRFDDEIVDTLTFDKKGILAMANAGPKTNGSQFFITQSPTPHLNGRHTIFGKLIEGEKVLDTIANTRTKEAGRPMQDVVIQKIKIIRKGKDAKNFNAVEVFQKYDTDRKEEQKKQEALRAVAREKVLNEFSQQLPQAKTYPSGIKIFSLKKGTGKKPEMKKNVLVNYAGYLQKNGELFDSNYKEVATEFGKYDAQRDKVGGYQSFPMLYDTSVQLIPGFKEAMLTMNIGDKIRVFIPAALGYGERGAGSQIPPNSDLVFDIEIVGQAK